MDKITKDKIQGHYRTTETNWEKVAPYIRFRYNVALKYLPAESIIYELGCGIGVGLNYLALKRPDLTFIGLDNSEAAIAYGRKQYVNSSNLCFELINDLTSTKLELENNSFLIALEVIEHLSDNELIYFKTSFLKFFNEVVFSFPYNQKNIEGTDHLQSFDIVKIFEIFPGFRTLFMRRGSLKFIGYWKRESLDFVGEKIGVAGEDDAITKVSNWK